MSEETDDDVKYLELNLVPAGGEPISIVETVEAFSLQDGFIVLLEWNEELDAMVPYRGYSLQVVERFEVHNQPPSIDPVPVAQEDTFQSLQSGGTTGGYYRFDPVKGLRAA